MERQKKPVGRPPQSEMSAFDMLFTEEIDAEEIVPGSQEVIRQNIAAGKDPFFNHEMALTRDEFSRLTEEERQEITEAIANNGLERVSRCVPSDFRDPEVIVRVNKAKMVNLYFEYGGNWAKVFRDKRSVSRRTMAVYWSDELFRAYIAALDPILNMEARGVVVEVWKDGLDEKARLAAALQWLAMSNPYEWDKGVRKQVVANKGSLQSALFNRVISEEEFLNAFLKDKLNKLPDNVRETFMQDLTVPMEMPDEGVSSGDIRTADMSKLKDPFGGDDE